VLVGSPRSVVPDSLYDKENDGVRVRRRPWRDYALALALVLAAVALVHGARIQSNFHRHHWEDWRFMRNARLEILNPLQCFTRPGPWPGLYRPLSANCYYLFGRVAFGNRVEVLHVVNVVIFVVNALLLFAIARRLLPPPWTFLPPVLFASRAGHFQVLTQTSEIQALLSSFFAFLAILWLLEPDETETERRLALALTALALALLCKESVIVVPAILAVHAGLSRRSQLARSRVTPWAIVAAWVVLFVVARRFVGGNEPTGFGYDWSPAIGVRYAAYFLSFFNLMTLPIDSIEMPTRVLAWARQPWALAAVALVGAAAAAVLLRARRAAPGDGARAFTFGVAWFVLGMAPFVVFADRLFVRYTYFGHAGLALAAAGGTRVLYTVLMARPLASEACPKPQASPPSSASCSAVPSRRGWPITSA